MSFQKEDLATDRDDRHLSGRKAAYKAQASGEGLSVKAWLKKLANEKFRPQDLPGIEARRSLRFAPKCAAFSPTKRSIRSSDAITRPQQRPERRANNRTMFCCVLRSLAEFLQLPNVVVSRTSPPYVCLFRVREVRCILLAYDRPLRLSILQR